MDIEASSKYCKPKDGDFEDDIIFEVAEEDGINAEQDVIKPN